MKPERQSKFSSQMTDFNRGLLLMICLMFGAAWVLASCALPKAQPTATASATVSPSPSATASLTPLPPTATGIWGNYPAPREAPVTPIPPPVSTLTAPSDVQALLLMGVDRNSPYAGRTDAVLIVFFTPKNTRASFLSIPPDLLMYIPGYTMQRLQNAYALGGADLVTQTLQYNLGITPQRWAVIHLDRFTELIDTLGGVTIDIPQEDHPLCGGLPTGETVLDGPHMLCYARSRQGLAENERNRRQQEVLLAVFQHLTHGGNLARLPELFSLFGEAGVTNLNLAELTAYIPLALQMSERDQFAFTSFSSQHMDTWQMPGMARSSVFLPRADAAAELVQHAANFVLTPAPGSSAKMATLVFELTTSPTPTPTTIPSATPRNTPTPTETEIPTETPTPTMTLTPTLTVTETTEGVSAGG